MEKIVALDIGLKRIGIAVTDPFGTYALPSETYTRKNLKQDLDYIKSFVNARAANKIVCGLPLNFDGSRSSQTDYTEYFITALSAAVSVPVVTADERCTTAEARRVLIESGKRREERKKYIDGLAAAYILEGYLKSNKKGD